MMKSCVRAKLVEVGAAATTVAIVPGCWTFIEVHPAARNARPETEWRK
jgi:hypothetical protein